MFNVCPYGTKRRQKFVNKRVPPSRATTRSLRGHCPQIIYESLNNTAPDNREQSLPDPIHSPILLCMSILSERTMPDMTISMSVRTAVSLKSVVLK